MRVPPKKLQRKRKSKTATDSDPPPVPSDCTVMQKDLELVNRCLKGDLAGWREMFDCCQPQMMATVQSLLKSQGQNINLAEEIAARVWFALVSMNGNLLERFDAHRGCSITTFCNALARHELLEYWRTERRHRNRELIAAGQRPDFQRSDSDESRIVWVEFVDTLTKREREFLERVLVAPHNEPFQDTLSQANRWQLRSRVLSKLKLYSNSSDKTK